AMLGQWLWLEGIDRRSAVWGCLTGFLMFLAVCLSLAFLPVGLILAIQFFIVGRSPQPSPPEGGPPLDDAGWQKSWPWRVVGGGALGFGLPILACWALWDLNLAGT